MAKFVLQGTTVIVTGGSRGIGPFIAAALTQHGARVALAARSAIELEAQADRLRDNGATVIAVPADVTLPEDRRALVDAVERELGPIDVLVNNAGGDLQREFHNLNELEIEHLLELNLTSAVILSR